jgi:diadenosine tetraphosphate (Ap4A) HIT family hydrolase
MQHTLLVQKNISGVDLLKKAKKINFQHFFTMIKKIEREIDIAIKE